MNTQLMLQIHSILTYLQQNASVMDEESMKCSVSNVLDTLSTIFNDPSSQETIKEYRKLLSSDSFDIYSFCMDISNFLFTKCCTSYDACSSELSSLSELNSQFQKRLLELNNYIDKVSTSFEHLVHVRNVYHNRYAIESDLFTGKGVVYTVITGGYDNILDPLITEDCFDYVLLTDKAPTDYHGKWQIRVLDNPQHLSAPLLARWAKIHPFDLFPDYDFSFYLDGVLQLREEKITDFIHQYKRDSSMICMPHHCYNNIDEDAAAVASLGKASKEALEEQIQKYRKEGFVDDILIETAVLVRSHKDPLLKKVMDDWWTELTSYKHHRDQMSFCYVCWKNNYEFDITDLQSHSNPWTIAYSNH